MTDNEKLVQHLEPKSIWKYFAQLSNIPRLSGCEKEVRDWLIGFAKSKNLKYQQDDYGNLVIYKPAQNSDSTKKLCLQAHLDMVPATDADTLHDFALEPLKLVLDGDWLKASGTTLGADNGIGVAPILAILQDEGISHPTIEALFTVEEETGLGGVNNLDSRLLNPDYIINLDNHNPNEREVAVCVGSAGGRTVEMSWSFETEQTEREVDCWGVEISGLLGGHSGVDIIKNIPNAVQVLASLLLDFSAEHNVQLVAMWGGEADNAIPASAGVKCFGLLDSESKAKLQTLIDIYLNRYKLRFGDIKITITHADKGTQGLPIFSERDSQKILQFVTAIPSGVIAMSQTVAGLVQTSNNLGVLQLGASGRGGELRVKLMARSDDDYELYEVTKRLCILFYLVTGNVLTDQIDELQEQKLMFERGEILIYHKVQGWQASVENELVKLYSEVCTRHSSKKVIVEAVHAGLECGQLLSYYPQAVAISVGPELHNLHTTREKLRISSVAEFERVLREVVSRL